MTIGQQIKWDFETNGELEISDKNGNLIYYEDSTGFWTKREYDSQGILIYYADSEGDVQDNRPKPYEGKIVEIEGI